MDIYRKIALKLHPDFSVRGISRFVAKYISPLLLVISFTLIRVELTEVFTNDTPFLFYTLVIFIYTWLGGFRSGMLTTLASLIVINYYLLPPYNSFLITDFRYVFQLFLYAIQCVIIVFVTNKLVYSMRSTKISHTVIAQSEESLRNIIDGIFMFIAVIYPDGTFKQANQTVLKLTSLKLDEIKDYQITDTYPWNYSLDVVQKLQENIEKAKSGNVIRYDEIMRIGKDSFIDVSLSIAPVYNDAYKVEYLIISAIDISERKSYELELMRIHQNYFKLINSNIIGMMIGDSDGTILEANDAYLNMIGYTKEDLRNGGIKRTDITAEEYQTIFKQSLEEVLKNGYIGPVEKEYIHKSGGKTPVILSGVLIDQDKGHILYLVLDISERKKIEEKKDEFISMASHELKTPLTTLKGYVQLLGDRLMKRYEENNSFVLKMDKQLVKLTDLINDLLDVTKIQRGEFSLALSDFDLVELVEETIQEVQPLTANHKVEVKPQTKPININADRLRIGQVVTNLLTNAIKYSPDDGAINVYVEEDSQNHKIIVEDYGIGIPEDKLDQIFQKFFRADNFEYDWAQGLGLGLYISSEIVKRHRGKIVVESSLGKGSKFTILLPKLG